MGEWQPIETAPKDGTAVLIYGRVYDPALDHHGPLWVIVVAHYDYDHRGIEFGGRGQKAPWVEDAGQDFERYIATHWMPLPDAPK